MAGPLVTAESLFQTYFWPLYPADAKANLAHTRALDANPGKNPEILGHLVEAARIFAASAPRLFQADLALDFSDASVHHLSAMITRERREAWCARGEAGTPDNELFNVVVHGAAYVGACAMRDRDAHWSVRRPLWESLVALRSRAGEGELAIFHWWLKSLADDALAPEAGDSASRHALAERYRSHVEVPTTRVEDLPLLAAPPRRLPRIAKVRYDVLYKHLKAHLPELKDLGADFPSPERFEELQLKWLDFLLVGEGRMLLLYGPGEGGLHLFWLDAKGFQKAAFFPADAFPEPIVREAGEKLQIVTSVLKKQIAHEVLWWGP